MRNISSVLLTGFTLFAAAAYTASAQSTYEPYSISTLAGMVLTRGQVDATGNAARFDDPLGLAVDHAGNIYVTDLSAHTIRKITPSGSVSTLAGLAYAKGSTDGPGAGARFLNPYGVAVDSSGTVYVADTGNKTIRKITPDGVVSTFAGLAGSSGRVDGVGSAARFNSPLDVAVDNKGNLYVGDSGSAPSIRKISPAGVVTTLAGGGTFSTGTVDGTGSNAQFGFPLGVAVDTAGTVYVADQASSTIRKVTASGVVTTLAGLAQPHRMPGSVDGVGSNARFKDPHRVAVDSAGNVFVSDTGNATIRKITPAAVVTTLAGVAGTIGGFADGVGSGAQFRAPRGIAVDGAGKLYIADYTNQIVRVGVATAAPTPTPTPTPTPPAAGGTLSNISTRLRVLPGERALIAGFIITGNQPKKVMIRGLGPSLPLDGALSNPALELDGGAMTNDDWRSHQAAEVTATTIPPSHDRESAIVATLSPGAHTAILRGVDNDTGVGLVEVYDLASASSAKIANISTRGFVQTGNDVMIGGFIVSGSASKVIVRAIGPSLARAGVSTALEDTTLELINSNGSLIMANDDWSTSAQKQQIIESTVPPVDDRESAIVATLNPGPYTAVVRGKNNSTGVALVEAYVLQ